MLCEQLVVESMWERFEILDKKLPVLETKICWKVCWAERDVSKTFVGKNGLRLGRNKSTLTV